MLELSPLRKVLMVGAIIEESGALSDVDRALLEFGIDPLRKAGLPVAPDADIAVEVMNKSDIYGNRDFLDEEGVRADILMLCNIPHKMDEDDYSTTMRGLRSSLTFGFREIARHELSDRHWDPGLWARKIKETGANVVISYGFDSMPVEQIMPEGYFISDRLKSAPSMGKFMMRNDFVTNLPFTKFVNSSPELIRFIVDSQKDALDRDERDLSV